MLHVVLIIAFHFCRHLSFIRLFIDLLTLLVEKIILSRNRRLVFLVSFLELLEAPLGARLWWLVVSIELLLLWWSWRLWVLGQRNKPRTLGAEASLILSYLKQRLLHLGVLLLKLVKGLRSSFCLIHQNIYSSIVRLVINCQKVRIHWVRHQLLALYISSLVKVLFNLSILNLKPFYLI